MRWFGHVERRNNNLVKKISEIRVKEKRKRGRPQKRIGIIEENMRVCGVNKNIVRDREQ